MRKLKSLSWDSWLSSVMRGGEWERRELPIYARIYVNDPRSSVASSGKIYRCLVIASCAQDLLRDGELNVCRTSNNAIVPFLPVCDFSGGLCTLHTMSERAKKSVEVWHY